MTENSCCSDNCFEIIAKVKEKLIRATNIEDCPKEMEVLDSILFRMWQCDFLEDNWHTGTPTEEGWYLCWVSYKEEIAPMVYKWKNGKFILTDIWECDDNILMWQKIEPYKEKRR